MGSEVGRPQRKLAAVNPKTAASKVRLRPKKLAIQPVNGRMMALATRYEVSAHAASSVLTERLPAMCGRETLTTVVSSTSMKVANITATATIHGLMCGCSEADGIRFLFNDAAKGQRGAGVSLSRWGMLLRGREASNGWPGDIAGRRSARPRQR